VIAAIHLLAADPSLKPHPWAWRPHPEVWVMVLSLALMYFYVTRVIGPKAVPKGQPIITRSQSRWFFTGLTILWVAADWPMHDIAEDYLYSVHMVQHLLLTWVVPPMMLLATPEWLARLVLGRGRSYRAFRFMARPLVAGVLYNAIFAIGHAPFIVDDSVKWAGFHFGVHTILVLSSILMWTCVCGPLKELRLSLPTQCIYLFLMSVLPTIPGGWLVFAESVVYKVYIHPWPSLWGLNPSDDQQLAGFIMKVVGGLYLWSIIIVLFFRWGREQDQADLEKRKERRLVREAAAGEAIRSGGISNDEPLLTFEDVQEAFDRTEAPQGHPPMPHGG
jgi:putative membrane protein